MIDENHDHLSIRRQCTLLKVWRSNLYYDHAPVPDETILANEIHELWLAKSYYGYRRITKELQRRGYHINHKRVLRIMRDMKIQALYPKHKTTVLNPENKVYPYLLRSLEIKAPDDVWQSDITYIKMPQGFMYLIAIIDVYSRYCVGWTFVNTMEVDHCEEMLRQSLGRGRKPTILNTDQGSQYTSPIWIHCVESHDIIKVSMDGKGRWADNIFIERFWRTMKYEHILLHCFETVKDARDSIGRFIREYNHERLHQSLGYATPAEVYGGLVAIPTFTI
jgi:putative transposase